MPTIPRRTLLAATPGLLATTSLAIPNEEELPRIKIGQIGTKHSHARGKLATIPKYPEFYEFVGIVEPDPKRAKEMQRAYPKLKWMTEGQLLNTKGLQAVAVETDVDDLIPTGIRCLEAGMHIHLDKPAGTTLGGCRRLHAEATKQKRIVQMGYMLRYNPAFEFLFKVVREGWLGEITEVSGMMGKKMGDGGRKELARYEGGGMFELACHLIDAVVTVLGKPTSVHPVVHRTYPDKDTFADNQLAVFDYPKAIATIRCNHIDPLGGPRRQFNVTGTKGTCEIRPLEPPKVRLGLDGDRHGFKRGFQEVDIPRPTGRYDGEFLDLARIIRGEKEFAWNAKHDLIVHEAVLRASGVIK